MSKKITKGVKAYQVVFASDEGKTVLQDLMKRCFLKDTTFDSDALAMAYREGARGVVLHIFNQLKIDIGQLESFMRERENNEESL